jgi:heat shock protein HslJ
MFTVNGADKARSCEVRKVIPVKRISTFALIGLLVASVALVAGCTTSAAPSKSAGDLTGNEWSLVGSSISSTDLGAAGITATFKGGQLSGFSGVNRYSGPYASKPDGTFKAGPLAGTQMAGPEPLMTAESAYLKLLEACDTYKVEAGTLTLSTGGNVSLTYNAATKAELPGSDWVVTGYNNGKEAVTGPAVDSTLTVAFGTDGKISGAGGVNRFMGDFESGATSVKIGPLQSTKMAGSAELMTQEGAYLTALQNSTTWEISSGKLTMRDAGGAMQVLGVKP